MKKTTFCIFCNKPIKNWFHNWDINFRYSNRIGYGIIYSAYLEMKNPICLKCKKKIVDNIETIKFRYHVEDELQLAEYLQDDKSYKIDIKQYMNKEYYKEEG